MPLRVGTLLASNERRDELRLVGIYSCAAKRVSTVRDRDVPGTAEEGQRETTPGVGNDSHRYQTLQQGLRQGWRGH